jgi:glycosyltransferase involved in cell wall biosynthesis
MRNPGAVLMICPQFRPIVGGYERSAERLSAALARGGLRVTVVTERRRREWPAREVGTFEIRRLFCIPRRRLHALTGAFSLVAYLLRNGRRFCVWHVHQTGLHAALAIAVGMLLRRPVVFKVASIGFGSAAAEPIAGLDRPWSEALHRRAKGIIVTSEAMREQVLLQGFAAERLHVLPYAVDGEVFRQPQHGDRLRIRARLGVGAETIALVVGRLAPEKNPLGMLDAWACLGEGERAGRCLVIVGDGPLAKELRQSVSRLGLASSVRIEGEQEDVVSWYQAADVLVIASHREGLSNAMIEALACGLPVISTRVSGSSVIEGPPAVGRVVELGNMAQLAEALRNVLADDALRSAWGNLARARFEACFSIHDQARRAAEIYGKLSTPTGGS